MSAGVMSSVVERVHQDPKGAAPPPAPVVPAAPRGGTFALHSSLSELVDRYDGFILDQFGVMHDGVSALPGAAACVEELHRRGKKIIILSNTSALASSTLQRLPTLGFDPSCFAGAVTSGEEAAAYIRTRLGSRGCGLLLTWKATPESYSVEKFLNRCGNVRVTDRVAEADFVLLHGLEVLRGPGPDGAARETSLGSYKRTGDTSSVIEPLLNECLRRKLPLLCVNPDYVYVKADGTVAHMPGKVADLYEAMGGVTIRFGKPHRHHFQACIRELGLPKERVVHVGDSLHHDVAGANAAGVPCVLVAGGVHRGELRFENGDGNEDIGMPSVAALNELFASHNQTPTHVVPMLRY
jgi:HAD superfamily hydrolase (TIGR01450 family)